MESTTVISFFFQAEDGIRGGHVTGVQTCALPIYALLHARVSVLFYFIEHGDLPIAAAVRQVSGPSLSRAADPALSSMRSADQGAHILALYNPSHLAWAVQVDNAYGHGLVSAQHHGIGIHDFQLALDHLIIADARIVNRAFVGERVGRIDAVHLGGLDHDIGTDFYGPQAGCGVGGEERIAGTGAEDDHAVLFKVAHGAPANVVLAHIAYRHGRHDAGCHIGLFQRVLKRQGVHDGGQHAHVVAGDAVDSRCRQALATKDFAAANDNADLDAGPDHPGDLTRDA